MLNGCISLIDHHMIKVFLNSYNKSHYGISITFSYQKFIINTYRMSYMTYRFATRPLTLFSNTEVLQHVTCYGGHNAVLKSD